MKRSMTTCCAALLSCVGLATASPVEYGRAVVAGTKLTAEEVESLDARLAIDAHDREARSRLIAYHSSHAFSDPDSRAAHRGHVLWLIRHAPLAYMLGTPHGQIHPGLDSEGYRAGKDTWARQLAGEPANAAFLGHAANFFSESHDLDLVVGALRKAQTLDADNWLWPMQLGLVYLRLAAFGNEIVKRPDRSNAVNPGLPGALAELVTYSPQGEQTTAELALEQLQRAYELTAVDDFRLLLLDGLASAALLAERYDLARSHARALLEGAPRHSVDHRHVHKGNVFLGRVALAEDDVALAKYHLLEAGRIPEPSGLGASGPNMQLAADLLERGERDVVLEYFELCANFWPSEKLEDWAALVRGGRVPDFGANLVY